MSQTGGWTVPGRPASRRARLLLLTGAAILVTPLLWVNAIFGSADFTNEFWITLLVCVIPPLTAAACFVRGGTATADPFAWRLVGIGLGCWALAAVSRFLFMDESGGRPVPALVDPFFMAMYPFVLAGLIIVLRGRLRSYRHLAAYDALTGFILLVSLAFAFLPGPIMDLTGQADDLANVVLAFYPLGDIGLLIMIGCLFRFSGRRWDGPWPAFGAGLALFAVADFIFAMTVPVKGPELSALYTMWFFGFLLMIYGSWRPDGQILEVDPGAVQLVPPIAFLTLALVGLLHGQWQDLWDSAVIGLTAVVVLVLVRLAISAFEYARKVQLSRIHMIDQLTGLPSRNQLEELLSELAAAPAWRDSPLFVLVVSIDRYGHIEESLGPSAMDEVILSASSRIRRSAGEAGILGVVDRGEFAVVCSQESAPDPEALTRRILRDFEPLVEVRGVNLQVRAVVGGAKTPEDTSDPDDLIRLALVSSAEARRDEQPYRLSPARPEMGRRHLHLLEDLRRALANGEIIVHYQPKVCTTDGRVESVEALVRWDHPLEGLLGPYDFVPLAEENGLGPRLTDTVAALAADQKRMWEDEGVFLDVAINLGTADLIDESLTTRLGDILAERGLEPGALTLEVSEDLVVSKISSLVENLENLKEAGFRISLDDFGSGATSLAHMRELPIDEIKIDRSLIAKMHRSPQDSVVGESAVMIAKRLGLNVVAEGAEEESTVERLALLDCGEIQSFYFARPMGPLQFDEWLRGPDPAMPGVRA